MAVQLIQPSEVTIKAPFPVMTYGNGFYLGYRRNAWNYTTINRYFSRSFALNTDAVKAEAEKLRVQGSRFYIEKMPIVALYCEGHSFLIAPINERGPDEYGRLLNNMRRREITHILETLPSSSENWLLVFKVLGRRYDPILFTPWKVNSRPQGGKRALGWSPVQPPSYRGFLEFRKKLADYWYEKSLERVRQNAHSATLDV